MDISESVGMGPWQLSPLLLTLFRGVPSAMLMMIMNFAAPRTRIWCNHDLEDNENLTRRNNLSENESATLGECWTKTNDSIVECKSWGFDHSVFSWTITEEGCPTSSLIYGSLQCVVGTLLYYVGLVISLERAWLRAMSQSFFMLGMLMGNLIFSHLSDRYGRRISVKLSSFLVLIFGFLGAFSPSLTIYNLTRVFAAIGTGGLQSTSVTLFMETVPSRHRILFSLTYGCGWIIGQECMVGVAYWIRNWRHMQIASSLFALPLIVLSFFMPESPRWLLTSCKEDEARREIQKAARINKAKPPNFQAISESMNKTREPGSRRLTLLDLMRGSNLRRTTFFVCYAFFALRILYFHLSFASALIEGNIFLNCALVEIMELPGKGLGALAMKYLRRKVSLGFLFFSSAVSLLTTLFFNKDSTWLTVSVYSVCKFFLSAAIEVLCVYAAELFPTCVRTTGLGSAYMISRLGGIISPFFSSIKDVAPYGVIEASLSGLQLLVAISLMFVPETFNMRLPDTLQDAEAPLRLQEYAERTQDSDQAMEFLNGCSTRV